MAEQLGTAVLTLDVDDQPFRDGLSKAQARLDKFGQATELTLTANAQPVLDILKQVRDAITGLKPDTNGIAKSLETVGNEANKAKRSALSLNEALNRTPANSYAKITAQIQQLATASQKLKLQSEEYVNVLQRIRELELIRNNTAGRQAVNAGFDAYRGGVANGGYGDPSRLPSLPNTKAADVQIIKELTDRLNNLDKDSAQYEITLRELESAQLRVKQANEGTSESFRQLQREQDSASRRAEKIASVQKYYADYNPSAGGIRDESGAMLARGAGARADERAYNAALRPAKELLELDLQRQKTINEISQRLLQSASSTGTGFKEFSQATSGDPIAKSIRRNQEKETSRNDRLQIQRDIQEADLARVIVERTKEAKREEDARLAALRRIKQALEEEKALRRTLIEEAKQQREEGTGFGGASRADFRGGVTDPIEKSIRRNRDKRLRGIDIGTIDQRDLRIAELNASPVSGKLPSGRLIPGSPAFLRQQKAKRDEALSNALIGGAFPALFGQGLGASVGGAAGGGIGGLIGGKFGFGASLIGTALGAQFDTAAKNAASLADALNDPIGKFQELADAGLISSKGLQRQIEGLIATGREAEAAALIQKDLVRTYGDLSSAKALSEQTDKLQRSWGEFTTTLAAFAAGPLTKAVELINGLLGGGSAKGTTDLSFSRQAAQVTKDRGPVAGAQLAADSLFQKALVLLKNPTNLVKAAGGNLQAIGSISTQFNEANRSALNNAEKRGETSADQRKANAALADSVTTRKRLIELGYQQAAAEAQNNKALTLSLALERNRLELRNKLAVAKSPEEKTKANEDFQLARQKLLETAKAEAEQNSKALADAKALFGLIGARLELKQRELDISKAQAEYAKAAAQAKKDPETANVAVAAKARLDTIAEEARSRAAISAKELADTRELITLYGSARSIREQQQKINDAEQAYQMAQKAANANPALQPVADDARNQRDSARLKGERAIFDIQTAEIAQFRQINVEGEIALRNIQQRIANAKELAAIPVGDSTQAKRQAVEQRQNITANVQEARDRVSTIGAQIEAQRLQGNDNTPEIARLVLQQREAAKEVEERLRVGAQAIRDSGRELRKQAEDAKLQLLSLQGGTSGVNRYIDPAQARQRQLAANSQLFSSANDYANRLGVRATFSGSLTDQNQQMSDFIDSAKRELGLTKDIADINSALSVNTQTLATVNSALAATNTSLAEQIANLARKSWSVNVSVPGGSASGDVVGAINGGY